MKLPRYTSVMKLIRRTHMYLGLLLYPWVVLYGLTGMLFNHPGVGREMPRRPLSAEQLMSMGDFTPWDVGEVGREIVTALNARDGANYRLEDEPDLVGFPILVGPRPGGGRNMMILSLTSGRAGIALRPASPQRPDAPFAGPLDVPHRTMDAIARGMVGLLPALDIAGEPLRPHPKVAPELHMRLHDGKRSWNAIYDLGDGTLRGRPSDGDSGVELVELLGRLHTQHHFPVHAGIRTAWAVLADLTGLCLMLWALSGLAMWWQMRRSHRWGPLAIGLSLGLAVLVMSGMGAELSFVPELGGGGP